MAEQTITIPENMELVKISDTEYKIVEKKSKLPQSWSEFCEQNPIKKGESWIGTHSAINEVTNLYGEKRLSYWDNLLPNKEYAEAILALCQLIQLRDCYRQGWKPDYKEETQKKYSIEFYQDELKTDFKYNFQLIFTFQTYELRDEFFNNFKDLIEKTKPLFM